MLEKILEIISLQVGMSVDELNSDIVLADIGIDSLSLMKIIMSIENRFDIQIVDEEIVDIQLISDITNLTVKKVSF